MWFSKKNKNMLELMENFVPTSKIQLKRFCAVACEGDLEKAAAMYEYYIKDINLPDFEPVVPTTMDQVKAGIKDIMSFVKNNQNELLQGYSFIQQAIANKGLPPIQTPPPTEPLPPIN